MSYIKVLLNTFSFLSKVSCIFLIYLDSKYRITDIKVILMFQVLFNSLLYKCKITNISQRFNRNVADLCNLSVFHLTNILLTWILEAEPPVL